MNPKEIFDKITTDNKKIILVALFFVGILYFDYSVILQNQIQKLTKLSNRIATLKKNIEKLRQDLVTIKDIKQKEEVLGIKPGRLRKIISDGQVPLLLKEISDIANKNQVRINQIKPVKAPAPKELKNASAQKMDSNLINLELSCDYHRLGNFINDLENAETFMVVDEIKIIAEPKDYFHQSIKLVIRTYVK